MASGIEIENLRKEFAGGVVAVDDLSLEVAEGEFMVLVGPSGCGKSTTLRMVAGLEEVSGGHDPHRRPRRHRPAATQARHRDGVPELRALRAHVGARQHRLRPEDGGRPEGRDRREGRRGGRDPRDGGPARPQAAPALGRPAPAGGDGPRDRARARRLPDGRAAVEPRREAAGRDARGDHEPPAADRHADAVRHPRPDRGDDDGRPGRDPARRGARAARHPRGALRAAR